MIPGRATSRAATWAARFLAVASIMLATTAVVLPVSAGLDYLPRLLGSPEVPVALAYATTGAVLVDSRRARSIGWLLLGIGAVSAAYASSVSYVAWLLGGDAGAALPADAGALATGAAWVTTWGWFPAWFLVSTVLPQLVPDGRVLGPRWRLLLGGTLLVGLLAVLDFAFSPGPLGVFERIENPVGSSVLSDLLAPVAAALDYAAGALILLSLASVVLRFARADSAQRRQIGWFGYAVVVAVVVILVGPEWAVNVGVLLIPAGLTVAAFRYRLFDLDVVANRTLVAVLLLGGGAVAYVALAAWVGALVGTAGGITPFVAALAVALVFHPARLVAQRWVDRLFFGRRGDPLALLHDLDQVLRDADTPRSALAGAVELVREGLRLDGAAVVVDRPHGGPVRAQAGDVPEDAVVLPLVLHEQEVGSFLVPPRGAEHRLGDADLRVLRALSGPLASAAYALMLSGDLEESHRRLLTAREDERRRLRRDLHDGLGPQLAGVVMGMDVVRSALTRGDAARAEDLAAVVADRARVAVEDVRRLVSGLRPPVLDDLGLLGALRAAWPDVDGDGPAVAMDATGSLTDLPAAVEVAAYRIVQEAVTNAVRHARATKIAVHLEATPTALCIRVDDDGSGILPVAVGGVGLASMRERAGELGGWCTISPREEGGTRVLAVLPRGA